MPIEYEATFASVSKKEIRQKLKQAGAKLVRPEFLQKRFTFDLPKGRLGHDRWARVRDEGDKITMSYKKIPQGSKVKINEQKEICLVVDNFNNAKNFLLALGCRSKSYQETKREIWRLGPAEITLDEWPYLEPFVEIEAGSERAVKSACQKLGLDYSQAKFCAVGALYKDKYGIAEPIINSKIPKITFHHPNPFNNLKNES